MGRRAVVFVLALAGLCALSAPAHAAFPGKNGKIAFSTTNTNPTYPNDDIYAINPDGSGLVQIVDENDGTWEDSNFDDSPEWSPDGTRLVFNSLWIEGGNPQPSVDRVNADGTGRITVRPDRYYPSWSPDGSRLLHAVFDEGDHGIPGDEVAHLFTIEPDGSNETFLRGEGRGPGKAEWSPDGTRIAFTWVDFAGAYEGDIYTADANDGTTLAQLTNTPYNEGQPDWSPDGERIAFTSNADGDYDIYAMNGDGTGTVQLTNAPGSDVNPSWSPDGTKIAFESNRSGPFQFQVFTMNADGSGQAPLVAGQDPDWQPIPVNAYPRPKSASPIEIALVPAYEPCASPNRTHGPSLVFGSCAPPVRTPGELTVGTPDSNGNAPRSTSEVHLQVLPGVPSTPADEADVRLYGTVNDVRLASDLSDYPGTLEARVTLRITDKDNSPSPGGPGAATTSDLPYSFPIPCSATADTGVGADCSFDTTAEAFVPGIAKEGRRAIWQLGQLAIHDASGGVFMRQGIFVP